ncbi:MAG: poly-gamma-glutamate hydrolase family protein [Gammaproteobacteria bacterium]
MHDRLNAKQIPRGRHQDRYLSFEELAAVEREDIDYRIVVREVPGASHAVITPHGGGIERGTTQIARAIAGDTHHLYLFEGLKPRGNLNALHITSRRFDEPRCLELVARSETVISVHGCGSG